MEYRKLKDIKLLDRNPRTIRDDDFKKLVQSIEANPDYFEARPLILSDRTGELVIIAGNQRYRAAKELKLKEVPTFLIKDLTEEREKEIIIRDNVSNGQWDFDLLANEWDVEQLEDWGLDIPNFERDENNTKIEQGEQEDFFIPDCIYNSNNIYDIPTLKIENQANELILPLKPYGAEARTNGGVGTYHFYVDDYRFESIWKNPINIIKSGCSQIVEPNLSLYDTTPISYGLFLIYKKRWIARFLQEKGFKVYADLNVSSKFVDYNVMGIPDGYNSFFTRGYTGRIQYLENELRIAQDISKLKEPNLVVYGGSQEIKEFCAKNNLTFIKDYINDK